MVGNLQLLIWTLETLQLIQGINEEKILYLQRSPQKLSMNLTMIGSGWFKIPINDDKEEIALGVRNILQWTIKFLWVF